MLHWHVFHLLQRPQSTELEVDLFCTMPKLVFVSPTINTDPSQDRGRVPFVYSLPHRFCFPRRWRQNSVDLSETLGSKTHLSNYSDFQMIWHCWHRKLTHNNLLHDRTPLQEIENVLDLLYPKAMATSILVHDRKCGEEGMRTCIVTTLSSTTVSFVRKSAPMVALYWVLNFLFTCYPKSMSIKRKRYILIH